MTSHATHPWTVTKASIHASQALPDKTNSCPAVEWPQYLSTTSTYDSPKLPIRHLLFSPPKTASLSQATRPGLQLQLKGRLRKLLARAEESE